MKKHENVPYLGPWGLGIVPAPFERADVRQWAILEVSACAASPRSKLGRFLCFRLAPKGELELRPRSSPQQAKKGRQEIQKTLSESLSVSGCSHGQGRGSG